MYTLYPIHSHGLQRIQLFGSHIPFRIVKSKIDTLFQHIELEYGHPMPRPVNYHLYREALCLRGVDPEASCYKLAWLGDTLIKVLFASEEFKKPNGESIPSRLETLWTSITNDSLSKLPFTRTLNDYCFKAHQEQANGVHVAGSLFEAFIAAVFLNTQGSLTQKIKATQGFFKDIMRPRYADTEADILPMEPKQLKILGKAMISFLSAYHFFLRFEIGRWPKIKSIHKQVERLRTQGSFKKNTYLQAQLAHLAIKGQFDEAYDLFKKHNSLH